MFAAFVQFPCPHCRRVIRISSLMVGRPVACPGCERRTDVPAPATPRRDEATSESSLGEVRSPFYTPPTG